MQYSVCDHLVMLLTGSLNCQKTFNFAIPKLLKHKRNHRPLIKLLPSEPEHNSIMSNHLQYVPKILMVTPAIKNQMHFISDLILPYLKPPQFQVSFDQSQLIVLVVFAISPLETAQEHYTSSPKTLVSSYMLSSFHSQFT